MKYVLIYSFLFFFYDDIIILLIGGLYEKNIFIDYFVNVDGTNVC